MAHDFAAQRRDTYQVYDDLTSEGALPDEADIDYFFVPATEDADWRPLADALSLVDYVCEFIEGTDEDGDERYLVATLPDQAVSAAGIWLGEEIATRAALEHGFLPDGWGLEG